MTKFILSLDGGGIRGIIPAAILAEIEQRTNKPIAHIFNLMGGTSTGALTVAGLSKKSSQGKPEYSAEELVNLYQETGPYIFKSSFLRRSIVSWFDGSQYPSRQIQHVLDKYLGDEILKNTFTNVLIPTFDIYNNCPFFFKSWKDNMNINKLSDVVRAASAAPTYFSPKNITVDGKDMVLIDGAIFANNPAACCYANTRKLFPNDDIVLLSLGTGRSPYSVDYVKSRRFGRISWVKPLLNAIFSSAQEFVNYQLERIIKERYIRIQSDLEVASMALDNVTPQNLENLKKEVRILMKRNKKTIDDFCTMVS